jgi:aspartyl-tRNA(Asn)/glutamyl-tRNA(Gln) amidotransferase subunit C
MSLNIDEIEKIAKLARLELSDEEKKRFAVQLADILEYVKQVNELKEKIGDFTVPQQDAMNLMRDDVAEQVSDPSKFVDQAPGKEGDFVKVKSILE